MIFLLGTCVSGFSCTYTTHLYLLLYLSGLLHIFHRFFSRYDLLEHEFNHKVNVSTNLFLSKFSFELIANYSNLIFKGQFLIRGYTLMSGLQGLFGTYFEGMDRVALERFTQDRSRTTTPLPLELGAAANKADLMAQVAANQNGRLDEADLLAKLAEDRLLQENCRLLSVHGDGDCCLSAMTVSLFIAGILSKQQDFVANLLQGIVERHFEEVMSYQLEGEYLYPLEGDRDLYKNLLDSVIERYRNLKNEEEYVEFCLSFLDLNITNMEVVSFIATCLRFDVRDALKDDINYAELIAELGMFKPKSFDNPEFYTGYFYANRIQLLMYRQNVEAREPRVLQAEGGFAGRTLLSLHIMLFQGADRLLEGGNHYYVMVMKDLVAAFEKRFATEETRPVSPQHAADKPFTVGASSKPPIQTPPAEQNHAAKMFGLKPVPKATTEAKPPITPSYPPPKNKGTVVAAAQAIFGGGAKKPLEVSKKAPTPAPATAVNRSAASSKTSGTSELEQTRARILKNGLEKSGRTSPPPSKKG